MSANFNLSEKTAQFISVLFHPLFMPLYTVILYFHLSSRYFLPQNIKFLVLYLAIVSILIPLLFFGLMFSAKFFSSVQLKNPRERLFFSTIMMVVYVIIFKKIVQHHQYIELYPFFLGIIFSLWVLMIYNFLNKKPSLHAMAIGGSLAFFAIWSYYSQRNILLYISLLILWLLVL